MFFAAFQYCSVYGNIISEIDDLWIYAIWTWSLVHKSRDISLLILVKIICSYLENSTKLIAGGSMFLVRKLFNFFKLIDLFYFERTWKSLSALYELIVKNTFGWEWNFEERIFIHGVFILVNRKISERNFRGVKYKTMESHGISLGWRGWRWLRIWMNPFLYKSEHPCLKFLVDFFLSGHGPTNVGVTKQHYQFSCVTYIYFCTSIFIIHTYIHLCVWFCVICEYSI